MKKKLLALFLAAVLMSETIFPSGILAKKQTFEGNITKNRIQTMAITSGKKVENLNSSEFIVRDKSGETLVSETKGPNGSISFKIVENEKSNIIKIEKNGDIFLDGSPVTITTYDEFGNLMKEERLNNYQNYAIENNLSDAIGYQEVQPLRAHGKTFFKSLPNGLTDANLTDHLGTTTKIITLGDEMIRDLSQFAFSTLVGLGFGAPAGFIYGLINVVYNNSIKQVPTNTFLSCKISKRKANNVGGYLYMEKVYTEFYATRNFTGYLGNTIYYWAYHS